MDSTIIRAASSYLALKARHQQSLQLPLPILHLHLPSQVHLLAVVVHVVHRHVVRVVVQLRENGVLVKSFPYVSPEPVLAE